MSGAENRVAIIVSLPAIGLQSCFPRRLVESHLDSTSEEVHLPPKTDLGRPVQFLGLLTKAGQFPLDLIVIRQSQCPLQFPA